VIFSYFLSYDRMKQGGEKLLKEHLEVLKGGRKMFYKKGSSIKF